MNIDPRLNEIKSCLYRISVKAVIVKDSKVLLAMDEEDTAWTFPGGGVDHGEKLENALLRELREELGVDESKIESDFNIIAINLGHLCNGIPRCNIHYFVKLNTDEIEPNQELREIKWFPISDLENLEYDDSAGDIKEIIDYLEQKF